MFATAIFLIDFFLINKKFLESVHLQRMYDPCRSLRYISEFTTSGHAFIVIKNALIANLLQQCINMYKVDILASN